MNILIAGFSGAGKSTLLKSLENIDCLDLDEEIVKSVGRPIADFVKGEGWERFREVEFATLLDILVRNKDRKVVIALGGGTLTMEKLKILRQCIWVRMVFINEQFETCYARIKGDLNRPLVQELGKEELFKLYQSRLPLYECADFTVLNCEEAKRLITSLVK
jgi:shikimate kinase